MALPLVFIAIGAVMLLDGLFFMREAQRTTATVISVERIVSSSGPAQDRNVDVAYLPRLRFTDSLGMAQEAVPHVSSGNYDYAPGDQVEILYSQAEPGTVRIAGFFSLWGLPLMLIVLGWVFLMVVRLVRRKVAARPAGPPSAVVRQ